jgi:hypothetical protein
MAPAAENRTQAFRPDQLPAFAKTRLAQIRFAPATPICFPKPKHPGFILRAALNQTLNLYYAPPRLALDNLGIALID